VDFGKKDYKINKKSLQIFTKINYDFAILSGAEKRLFAKA
jgi:hypothetical protein